MSISKKNALAAALVLGLGMAGTAGAYSIGTTNTTGEGSNAQDDIPELVATADIASNTTVYTLGEDIFVNVGNQDAILGRSTGFNVRIDLLDGARFGAAVPTPTRPTTGSIALPANWNISVASGGTAGSTFVIFAIQPPAGGTTTIDDGVLFSLEGVALRNLVTGLTTGDNTVSAQVRFIDPVAGSDLPGSTDLTNLLRSGQAVASDCDTTEVNPFQRIDIGRSEDHEPKTYFTESGVIGSAGGPDGTGTVYLGDVGVERNTGFNQFAFVGTDEFTTTLTGNFAAFGEEGNSIYLATDDSCSTEGAIEGTVNAAGNRVTFNYTGAQAGAETDGFQLAVCASVAEDNAEVIQATTVTASTVFTRDEVDTQLQACSLAPLQYNGSVVSVYNINPAGNSTAQSFIRVINPSSLSGTVTIVGTDDQGNEGAQPVTFTLEAGKSMQVNSEDLENGNAAKGLSGAFGDGAGKWRAVVNGEFADMVVQSLNRNSTDGTVTNLTDGDTQGEQVINNAYNNGGGFGPYAP